jgi:hypothetical protein
MACRGGCDKWFHLKNQPGCGICIGFWQAKERADRNEAAAKKKEAEEIKADAFFNPAPGRKKPRNLTPYPGSE